MVATAAALTTLVAACGSSGSSSSTAGVANAGSSSSGGSKNLPTVTMMVGGIDKQIYMEYQLAQDLGYFTKYGVHMVLSTEASGGVGAETAMVNGSVDMAGAWYIHTAEFQVQGKSVVDLINLGGAPGEREMCSMNSGIHSPSQWKGKTLGVTDLGSGTDGLTKFMAARAGLNPKTDISRLAVGAGPTAVAALQRGSAQCVMTTQPTVAQLEQRQIAYSMANLASSAGARQLLGGVYPAAGVLAQTSWVNAHPTEVQDVVDALAATLHYMATHSAADIAAHMPPQFVTEGVTKATYISSLAADKSQFMPTGVMPAGAPALAVAIDRTAGVLTPSQHVNLATTYTNKYVQVADKLEGITP
ncbi:MAG TPA: ABC transporter substrate-binding protein [Solirubrobacteraceae bacterium]|nr:ABC transporter substrate-binding protein [Solirubrobacteraceae bacterium]